MKKDIFNGNIQKQYINYVKFLLYWQQYFLECLLYGRVFFTGYTSIKAIGL